MIPMPAPQSFKSHTRFHPLFHFILAPLLLLNIGFMIYLTIHQWPDHPHLHPWWIVMSIVLLLVLGAARGYALTNQNRLIRLEERLRLTALLPPADHPLIHTLATPQLIALRFASDAELPTLARRTAAESLDPKQIKQAITTWRPDYERV